MKEKFKSFLNRLDNTRFLLILSGLFIILAYCNIGRIYTPSSFLLDTAVQIKAGLDMINNGIIPNGDIYSWHEGLNWVPHEIGWYFLMGLCYKFGGVLLCTILCTVLGYIFISICLYITKKKEKASMLSILIIFTFICNISLFPMHNIRPQTISIIFFVTQVGVLMYANKNITKLIVSLVCTMLTLMFHGGFLMMPFVLLAVYYGVRLVVNKDIKDFGWGCLTALVCFISTLITSYGRSCWTYSNKQSMYPEIRNNISEWMSMDWGIELFIPCLLILIGLIMDKRFRDKDADHLCKIAYYCAFFVGACIYCRLFILQGVFFLLFGPKALDNLIMFCKELFSFNRVKTSTKLNIKSNKIKFKLKDTTKQNIALIMCCILFGALLCVNIAFFMDFKDNTVNDTAVVDGYDTELIDFIKDNGYEKIYNDYTIGTWLLFNDIKVHIDNRLDPYLKSYSGVDTIHNSMYINNLIHMNDFRDKYHPDVFIFHSQDATDKIEAGEQYEHLNNMENFFEMIDTYESDRYKKVYDSTTYSVDKLTHEKTKSSHKHHWVVYECIY